MGKGGIPDRWEAYTNMGRQIPGTRFITFKVPLREELLRNVPNEDRWSPRDLVDHCKLGLVVDLTNTKRYYDSEEFTQRDIQYEKLETAGKVLPTTRIVNRFIIVVNEFLKANKKNDKLIGVHCTHGLNRSGYVICRYMIHQLEIPADQAIADFNSARGHEQERPVYLNDLRTASWINSVVTDESKPSRWGSHVTRGQNEDYESSSTHSAWSSGPRRRWSNSPASPEGGERRWQGARRQSNPYSYSRHQQPSHNSSNSDMQNSYDYSQHNQRPYFNPPGSQQDSWDYSRPRPQHVQQESPNEARRYYDNRYQGRVAPQYQHGFYQQEGSGYGPQRVSTRWASKAYQEQQEQSSSYRPRQYRGPRPYRSPEKQDEVIAPQTPQVDHKGEGFSTPSQRPPQSRNQMFSPERFNTPSDPHKSKNQMFSPEGFNTPSDPNKSRNQMFSPEGLNTPSDPPKSKYQMISPERFNTPNQHYRNQMVSPEGLHTPYQRSSYSRIPPDGPKRHPISPGAQANVFSPENNSRRHSSRWNPY